ncbi:DEK domain-containing chromatin-associated protein 2 isoform X2 [Musa acuminata AAA Group]|uniref:DEK domain-containing chromatin-associated protein 2 isoform X2 n=1 Tax=Musa acuminata AAA Group TaxID=214697 RepID=UPI0031D02696
MDSAAVEETKKAGDGSPTGEAELEEEAGGNLPAVRAEAGEEESKEEEEQTEGGGDGPTEKVVVEKRKRGRRPRAEKSGDGEEGTPKKERKRRSVAREEATPVERPSRERKTVERFSEMALPKAPVPKTPSFKQGSGDKLKDIPNVSFKLSKRKVDENLQALHTVLFGRKSNARFLRRNILQFSGFVWSENEEKQRARIKEKLDKYNKERLLDFCDLLDIHVVKPSTKKEEVILNLVEFLESPCVTRDVILTEKKGKRGRRTKGSTDATSGEGSSDRGSKKQRKGHKQSAEDENEDNDEGASVDTKEALNDDDDDDDGDDDDEDDGNSQEENGHDNSEEEAEDGEQEESAATNKRSAAKHTKKTSEPSKAKNKINEQGSNASTKDKTTVRKDSAKVSKTASTSSPRKSVPVDDSDSGHPSISKSKQKGRRKGRASEKLPDNKENTSRKKSYKSDSNEKQGKVKASKAAKSGPSKEELHAVVSDILKEVDFNTATLADILRQLGAHFKMDLMDRKAEVKRIIEDVINSMSDDDDEDGEEDEGGAEDAKEEDDTKEDSDGDGDK